MSVFEGLRAGLKSSGLDSDVEGMAKYFGVSEKDFLDQIVKDIQEGGVNGEESLQRISSRITEMKKVPKLTLVIK
jgi:hypothetical protein